MKSIQFTVSDPAGLHARPVSILVKEATAHKSNIQMLANGKTGNLKSIFSIMGMGVVCGTPVEITIDGEDEEIAFDKLSVAAQEI